MSGTYIRGERRMSKAESKAPSTDKDSRVLELRRAGLTWQRIAEEVGYADHSGAHRAYQRAIRDNSQQGSDELLRQELDRLDRLQVAAWPQAMKGDAASMSMILKIIEQRVKLLGLTADIKVADAPDIWDQLAAEISK
jgi:hypothetical protein